MSKEDALLTQSLKKLKIESPNAKDTNHLDPTRGDDPSDVNGPMFRRRSKSLSQLEKCTCPRNFLSVKPLPFKRTTARRKLLRDPVLNFVKYTTKSGSSSPGRNGDTDRVFGECSTTMTKERDFKSLVTACKKISLSGRSDGAGQGYASKSFRQFRYGKGKCVKSTDSPSLSSSCAHQARMNVAPPCDITIDELASYFETFVHIPKKMSVMAEMMYI